MIAIIKSHLMHELVQRCMAFWQCLRTKSGVLNKWISGECDDSDAQGMPRIRWCWQSAVVVSTTESLRLLAFQDESSQVLFASTYPKFMQKAYMGLMQSMLVLRSTVTSASRRGRREALEGISPDTRSQDATTDGRQQTPQCTVRRLLIHGICSLARLLVTAGSLERCNSRRPLPSLPDGLRSQLKHTVSLDGLIGLPSLVASDPAGANEPPTSEWNVPTMWNTGKQPWVAMIPSEQQSNTFEWQHLAACFQSIQSKLQAR